ncbi:hypothetical protein [Escherichia coli]|uniref:hypothetical protein n=1 Tax=Escherichia coli TaxID=562 RepID=UPI003EE8A814
MTISKNNSMLEVNKTVEQMLAKDKWQDALNFWINNTDSLILIKWLAKSISQSSSEEDDVFCNLLSNGRKGMMKNVGRYLKNLNQLVLPHS